jgi:hypothetical protein
MRRVVLLLLTAGALALALAGCGPAPAAGPTDPTTPAAVGLQPMTLTRTGGIAGVHEQLRVDPDGRWSYSGRRALPSTGQLDEAARTRLAQIQADTGLPDEIRGIPDVGCCDQFTYELRIAERSYTFEDLGEIGPLVRELLDILRAQTGF